MHVSFAPARLVAALALLLVVVSPAGARPRPGQAEEADRDRAAARPPVRFLRAADLLPGALAEARAWSGEAALVWVENADSLAVDGSSRRWTFVFAAPERGESRAFTLGELGATTAAALPFPFDPLPVEDGWIEPSALLPGFAWGDPRARPAVAGARVAVLSRGLLPGPAAATTTWYVGQARGPGAVLDALRGTTLAAGGPGLAGGTAAETDGDGLPPFLRLHRAALLERLERERATGTRARRDRARALAQAEPAALARLATVGAGLDTLGRGAVEAAGSDVERTLARLAVWRAEEARAESLLAASDVRVAEATRDLAAGRPTELAVVLALERRARPARVRVLAGGHEIVRRAYGLAEWNALDAGAWSEVVRASVRPGATRIEVEIEGADRRVTRAEWTGTLPAAALTLLRLELRGSGEGGEAAPRLERLAGTTP